MAAEHSARKRVSPLVVALRLAIEEATARKAAERLERRGKMRLVDGGIRRDAA